MNLPILEVVPDDLPLIERCDIVARNLGREVGANFAHWVAQDTFGGRCTRDHKANARAVLESIESCDHTHMDVQLPNLSGENNGDPTPSALLEDVLSEVDATSDDGLEVEENLDSLCDEWEAGVTEGYEWQLAELARSTLE